MIWRIVAEVLFVVALLFLSSSFWACLKAPAHLRRMLADETELRRLIEHFVWDTLYSEAQNVRPLPMGYGNTLVIWDAAHYKSLSSTRNYLGVGAVLVLAGSWWLGVGYFLVNARIFALMGLSDVPASAKNNNARHLPTVILNLTRWIMEDKAACMTFCTVEHAEYRTLYDIVVSMMPQRASAAE
jgi:hypothetical protein